MAGTDTFNDKAIRAALKRAADTGKGEKLPDGAGLRLDVQPSGAGWWRLRYRFGGREGMLSLGVYPSLQTKDRPMSENTVNVALRRMGFDRETATAHGFRATARTMAAERLGIAPEVIEAQLTHAVGDALGRACNRTTFADQRRELMTKWADYLDRLRKGGDVTAMPERAA